MDRALDWVGDGYRPFLFGFCFVRRPYAIRWFVVKSVVENRYCNSKQGGFVDVSRLSTRLSVLVPSLLLVLLLAAPHAVYAQSLEGLTVVNVLVEGLDHAPLTADELLAYVKEVRRGIAADKEMIARDAKRILDSGFVYEVSATLRQIHTDSVAAVFSVVPHPIVSHMQVQGVQHALVEDVLNQMHTRTGTVISTKVMEEDAKRINDWYAANGYPLGRMTHFDMTPSGELSVYVDEGVALDVRFIGQERLNPETLAGLVPIKKGDIITAAALEESVSKLVSHPRVARVRSIGYEETPSGSGIVLVFEIEEQLTGRYELGAGYNTRDGFLMYGSIGDTDFLNTGRSLQGKIRLSQKNSAYDLEFVDPTLPTRFWDSYALNVYRRHYYGSGSDIESKTGASLSIAKTVLDRTHIQFGASFNTLDDGTTSTRLITLDGLWRQSFERGSSTVQASVSLPVMSSHYDYYKGTWTLVHKEPLPFGTLAGRFQAGLASGSSIPRSEMYRLGGIGTLRGFEYASIIGDHSLALTVEYRTPAWHGTSAAVFYDTGDAWLKGSEMSLKSSYGVGARIDTPIGTLQLDYASDEHGEFKFVLGLGQMW